MDKRLNLMYKRITGFREDSNRRLNHLDSEPRGLGIGFDVS